MIAAGLLAVAVATAPLPPVVYQAANRDYDVRLRIAPTLKTIPGGAYEALKAKAVADLKAFQSHATKDMALARSRSKSGPLTDNPEAVRVQVDLVVLTPHLAGFIRRDYVDAHGAHPGSDLSGLIYDRKSGRRLSVTDLLRPGADMASLNAELERAVRAAKTRRGVPGGLNDGFVKPGELNWSGGVDLSASHNLVNLLAGGSDPKSDAPVLATLTASTVRDHAGGLQFLYSPYDIGSYAEGPYRVVLPWRGFAQALKPEYRADFAGAPAGDLRPNPLMDFPTDLPPMKP